jgi:potassium voltage-gated channel Eag-related subfamily H protein 8
MYKTYKKPLVYIYNVSLSSSIFPNRLKTAKVKPLYKKGDIHDVKNYRPIAILSVFSKILEKLMYNTLIPFFSG